MKPAKRMRAAPGIVPLTPQEHAISYSPILYGNTPKQKPGSQGVEDIAAGIHARSQAALKAAGIKSGRITGPNPQTDEMLSRIIAHEISQNIVNSKSERSAGSWYTGNVEDAMAIAKMLHPEMEENPFLEHAYKLALAVTSQGEKVWPNNVRYADRAFNIFKTTGQFPTNFKYSKQKFVNGNFQKLNDLFATYGPEKALNMLHSQYKVRDLEAMKLGKIGGENKDEDVHGSAILGAKIGNGFYQNLRGNYNPTTFDLWWMRGWGRLTGGLSGQLNREAAQKTKQRYLDHLAAAGLTPNSKQGLVAAAQRDVSEHERNYRNFRPEYDAGAAWLKTLPKGTNPEEQQLPPGVRIKTQRTLSAERYLKSLTGINESPKSGGQRSWMRAVTNRAREILADHGHHITNADLQALWWYPEKDLYQHLGGRKEDLNMDYATAMQNHAKEQLDEAGNRKFSDADIQQALESSRRGRGQ